MEPFKNKINREMIRKLAAITHVVCPDFSVRLFEADACTDLENLALKARVDHVTRAWRCFLPAEYRTALAIVLRTLPPLFEADAGWGDTVFLTWIHSHFVQLFGLDDVTLSLDAMVEITQRGSCEFAVRPYLKHYPVETRNFLSGQLSHPSPHVRRWISEGTRPRLPWGERLDDVVRDPSPNLPLLFALRKDTSKYVQNSVANHIGDIAKDHPALAVQLAAEWMDEGFAAAEWIAKRALRHLIKQGHRGALKTLGYGDGTAAVLRELKLDKDAVAVGDSLCFQFSLSGKTEEKLNVDYAVDFAAAKGGQNRKVFKLKSVTLKKGETMTFKKVHSFKKVTTRTLYPGKHAVTILVNGRALGRAEFVLKG